jgi:hypothetical protein
VDGEKSIAQGGNGVVTPGCPACRKRLFTMANFMDHRADDVLPRIVDKLSGNSTSTENNPRGEDIHQGHSSDG